MVVSSKWFVDPIRLISLLFGIQFFLWLIVFPEEPMHLFGEPKCYDIKAQIMFWSLFAFLIGGVFLGKKISNNHSYNTNPSKEKINYFRYCAYFAFILSFASILIQISFVLKDPFGAIMLLFEPGGQENSYGEMIENRIPGVATLFWSLPIALTIFSFSYFLSPVNAKTKNKDKIILFMSFFIMLAYSTFGRTRQSLLIGLLTIASVWLICKTRYIKLSKLIVYGVFIVLFVWSAHNLRQGIAFSLNMGEPVFSKAVQSEIYSELVEKYVPGEFNNALIYLSYETDITKNIFLSSMFDRLSPDSFQPPRYVNTSNTLALWYWQTGYFSPVVALLVGLWLGWIYRKAKDRRFGFDWASLYLSISIPSIFAMIRVNSFFLWSFVVPLLFLIFMQVIWIIKQNFIRAALSKN